MHEQAYQAIEFHLKKLSPLKYSSVTEYTTLNHGTIM